MNRDSDIYIAREKAIHIVKAARAATLANVLAPLLCIPLFIDEAASWHLNVWLAYMALAVTARSWVIHRLEVAPNKIPDPEKHLRSMAWGIGLTGVGWGLGWLLVAPDLQMTSRMIYAYIATATLISSMFAYSVDKTVFYAFTAPNMASALISVALPQHQFPWPFSVGVASMILIVVRVARNFSKVFEESVRLRFRNESLYQDLAKERDQSIAASVAKSKFISVASHDLRQPLQAINVYLDLISSEVVPAIVRKALTKIQSSTTVLNGMFEALLNINKLDAHLMDTSLSDFQLQEMANTVHDLMQGRASQKGLKFHVHASPDRVHGDPFLLRQILLNLVANAIQYTQQGEVDVRLTVRDGHLVMQVQDTGCGMAAQDMAHIFNEFYRADRTRVLHDGLGLGLSIVHRICRLIGADIHVASQEGEGSTFTVTTAYPQVSQAQGSLRSAPLPPARQAAHKLQGKTIVILEDDAVIAEAYRHTLAVKGASVHILSEQAQEREVQLRGIDHIDCILSDYRLGSSTGDALIQALRENYNQDIPAVIVTADTSPEHIQLFSQLNIPVLHKPISFQAIVATIEASLHTDAAAAA